MVEGLDLARRSGRSPCRGGRGSTVALVGDGVDAAELLGLVAPAAQPQSATYMVLPSYERARSSGRKSLDVAGLDEVDRRRRP